MPVGVCAQAAAMARPRAAVSAIASSTVSTPASAAAVSSPTLCPVMTTSPPACGVCATGLGQAAQLAGDEEAHRDDEGLGDRGVLDRLGVTGGAERQEIGAGDGAGPSEEGFRAGQFQPVGEHSGFLRALSGGEDGQHLFTVPVTGASRGWRAARKHTGDLCRNPPKRTRT